MAKLQLFVGVGVPLVATACANGGGSDPVAGANVPTEVVACRARVDSPFQFAEIALRDARNLGTARVGDRTGTERAVRLHPDGATIAFARERTANDPDSRELFVSSIDGSRAETRLSSNSVLDDEPCWSPDGTRILFASARGGTKSLWLADAATGDAAPFVVAATGTTENEPDWARSTDRVVWSHRDAAGHHVLWIAQGNGAGAVPLTDGGATAGADTGDHMPAFSPDGSTVAFVRRTTPFTATLCTVVVASGAVSTLVTPIGDVALPRFAPANDRLWFGIAEPGAGRATMRLATVATAGGTAALVWPDERWSLEGFDLVPALAPAPVAAAPVALDVQSANVQIAAGSAAFGNRSQLQSADGDEFVVVTETLDGREVAGINVRFTLPIAAATDVLELRIRAVARSTRAGGDSVLRMSIYNPVDERFDTAFETPAATTARTMTFATSSLRHVTAQRELRVTVIADVAPGAAAELHIDEVAVDLVARSGP